MDPAPAKLRVLLIEDQRPMAENIWEFLESCGQVMDHAADGQAGLQLALDNTYDAIVLDIGLPKLDGIEVCRRYRAQGGTAPILMLTARDRIEDKLLGFEAGADDYLTKPFELRELAARIQVLHKRQQRQSPAILRIGDLALDVVRRNRARRDDEDDRLGVPDGADDRLPPLVAAADLGLVKPRLVAVRPKQVDQARGEGRVLAGVADEQLHGQPRS